MRLPLYFVAMLILNASIALMPWGSAYLSLAIALTYLTFRPTRVLHPNNMLFAFYGLYVILSSTLNLTLSLINWEYVLPWGQQIFWETFSRYTLFQAEFTFLVLFFGFHAFSKEAPARIVTPQEDRAVVRDDLLAILYVVTFGTVVWYIEVTAGLSAWLNDYSFTYLTKREGHGLLNVVTIVLGNIVVFLLGLKIYQSPRKMALIAWSLLIMFALSFIDGVKSRFIFLLILLLSPYFMTMRLRLGVLAAVTVSFFVLLYLGTLVRTEGFYASAPFFLEMLVGYFNAFQLHDWIVTSRDPALFQTVGMVFTKPMQIFGIMPPDANFDISVMLTKEFFPKQWDDEHATQQWPLDTELYLNYYGFYLSWLPLLAYSLFVSWLYRLAVLRRYLAIMPIFIMEFQRIFSTMRGTLIPWEVFIYIAQYLLIYVVCRQVIRSGPPRPRAQELAHA